MSKNVQPYKDSLYFNQYDIRVIVSGSFNREKFLVTKLQNLFEGGNVPSGFAVLEVLPIYSIGREDGIFVKRHLQNYNNVHSLLISKTIAIAIKKRWDKYNKNHYIISFVKTKLFSRRIEETNNTFYCIVSLLSGPCIMTSANVTEIYFKPPKNFLGMKTIKIQNNIATYKCQNIVEVDLLNWRTYSLMEPSEKQKFTEKVKPKCTVSVLNNKLPQISEPKPEIPSTSKIPIAAVNYDINRNITEQHRPQAKAMIEPVLPQKKVQKVQPMIATVRPLPSVNRNANRFVLGTAARFGANSGNTVNDASDYINGNANTSTNRSVNVGNSSGIRNQNPIGPPSSSRRNVFTLRTPSRLSNINMINRRNGGELVFDYLNTSTNNHASTSTSNANRRSGNGRNSLSRNVSSINFDLCNLNNNGIRSSSNTTNRSNNSTRNGLSGNVNASNQKVTPIGGNINRTRTPTLSNPFASNSMQSNTVRVSRSHPGNSNNYNNLHIDNFIRKLRRARLFSFSRNCRIFYPKGNTQILLKRTNVLQPSTRANAIGQRRPTISVPTLPRAPRKTFRNIANVNEQGQNNGSSRPLITDELDFDLNLY